MARPVEVIKAKYPSGDVAVPFDFYKPGTPGGHPAVIMVHGAAGLSLGLDYKNVANFLADHGYTVFIPHYFERVKAEMGPTHGHRSNFAVYLEALKDMLNHAIHEPLVDTNRIGFLGVSLGSYLALALATQDWRIKAVVEYFGGLPDTYAQAAGKLPPVLILHGDADRMVYVGQAYGLAELMDNHNKPYEMKIYPGADHVFQDEVALDAIQRTVQFFDRHL